MKSLDVFLQHWRFRKVRAYLKGRVIDIGAYHGEFFEQMGDSLQEGFGVEPLLETERLTRERFVIRRGYFPDVKPEDGRWDCVSMLAGLEHIPREKQKTLAESCHALLKDGGRVVITVPSPAVDAILALLWFFKLIDGMPLEEHMVFDRRTRKKSLPTPGSKWNSTPVFNWD